MRLACEGGLGDPSPCLLVIQWPLPEPVPVLPEPVPVLPELEPGLPEPLGPMPLLGGTESEGPEPVLSIVPLPVGVESLLVPVLLVLLGSFAGLCDPQATAAKPSTAVTAIVVNRIIFLSSSVLTRFGLARGPATLQGVCHPLRRTTAR